jgi:hypothetical protein
MDRQIVYPGSIPLDSDVLHTAKHAMIAAGFAERAMLGPVPVADGFACTPTAPASLTVNLAAGSLTFQSTVDATDYGTLPADIADGLLKRAINLTATTLTLAAPPTSGQSINYLIEAGFSETDTTPIVLPYYNAANPAQPYAGPSNTGVAQNTVRQQRVNLRLSPGAPAVAGSQTTPAADTSYVPLCIVTVAYGQSAITAGNIVQHPNAPFLAYKLPALSQLGAELVNLLANVLPGVALNLADPTQIASAVRAAAIGVRVLTYGPGTYSWTVPAGVYFGEGSMWGGGGGGGGCSSSTGCAVGGGAGAHVKGIYPVTPGQVISITVGAGGAAGLSTGANGTAGGTTSFGSFGSAPGGNAGASSAGGVATGSAQGGVAPTGSGGTFRSVNGQGGSPGLTGGNSTFYGGQGGASPFGGGIGRTSNVGSTSDTGNFPGAGGNGGGEVANGGAGGSGYIEIRY